MTTEEYLDQIKKYDVMIKNRTKEYQRALENASSLGGFSVTERVQSSRNLHKDQNAIAEYLDIERDIARLKEKRQKIIDLIERLPFVEYKTIYILFVEEGEFTLKDIAWEFHKSYDWAKKRKRKALRMIQRMREEGNS